MSDRIGTRSPWAWLLWLALGSTLSACQRSAEQSAQTATPAGGAVVDKDEPESQEGVALKPDEIRSLGIELTPARAMTHARQASGFGVVIGHEVISQAVNEMATAAATAAQSHAALSRARELEGTPGAMARDVLEAARRQTTVDQAAELLARQTLSASFGRKAPWAEHPDAALLRALADGEPKLVRVTFPLGSLDAAGPPVSLRLSRLDALDSGTGWNAATVWPAPADPSLPGSSFFALLRGTPAREGEHLVASTPVGPALVGVWIPASAVVISGGAYWCYVQMRTGSFVRRAADTRVPWEHGYFLDTGIAAGEPVVSSAAALLLARETNPSTGAD